MKSRGLYGVLVAVVLLSAVAVGVKAQPMPREREDPLEREIDGPRERDFEGEQRERDGVHPKRKSTDGGVRRGHGKLERITLAPETANRAAGQVQNFTATGHYEGGETRNLTQQVIYKSSDAAVARTPNTPGKKSRVEAVGPGVATISATDPVSGISSTASKGDATLSVLGALERIVLTPAAATRGQGEPQSFTATGYYAGGTTKNLTQHVAYTSSDPAIAVAPNTSGRRSRIETIGLGTATISATDPKTGISTTASGGDATLTVVPPGSPSPGPVPTP